MQAERSVRPDWRDAGAYRPLLDADRSLIAWEWLRRDPQYRSAAELAGSDTSEGGRVLAERFGLAAFEPPHLAVPDARPVWRASVHPAVLRVSRSPAAAPVDSVDVQRLGPLVRLIDDGRREHLLLSDGLRTIRLDGASGTFTGGPVRLAYRVEGVASAVSPLLTLRRFLALARSGLFAAALHRREPRAARWILMLRVADALAEGQSQRVIAGSLLRPAAADGRWRDADPSLRSQAQRLVRSARHFAAGGYRSLLQ
jgi:hypothetical protein